MFFPCIFPCKLTLWFSQERVLKWKSWRKQTSLKIQFYSYNCLKQHKNPKKVHMTRSNAQRCYWECIVHCDIVVGILSSVATLLVSERKELPLEDLSFENRFQLIPDWFWTMKTEWTSPPSLDEDRFPAWLLGEVIFLGLGWGTWLHQDVRTLFSSSSSSSSFSSSFSSWPIDCMLCDRGWSW